ncbi:Cytochrome c3 domain-containing protein [Desulfonema limicola]|uniref:Cytochrome c3 domain-containing protein n=1 Tax=Desulfonema limicola TaxID=45656 RepID=A0A975GHT4_9BACT|nr:cytochrome c3 family protein [Desulfonema limicola]QTA81792.1 Cytochrome c3 domain-containing protein [Desulfonema limicola]
MQSGNYSHLIRIILGIIVFAVFGFIGKKLLTPESFGVYGHFRADAIEEEAAREIRHWTNASCLSCHAYEAKIHLKGRHKTISCEFCHGPYADHVKDGKKTGTLPVKKGEDMKILCMRCHNKAIQARPGEVIKTVVMPDHLTSQKVKETHNCSQCHHVHAPLMYIEKARKITGFDAKEAL